MLDASDVDCCHLSTDHRDLAILDRRGWVWVALIWGLLQLPVLCLFGAWLAMERCRYQVRLHIEPSTVDMEIEGRFRPDRGASIDRELSRDAFVGPLRVGVIKWGNGEGNVIICFRFQGTEDESRRIECVANAFDKSGNLLGSKKQVNSDLRILRRQPRLDGSGQATIFGDDDISFGIPRDAINQVAKVQVHFQELARAAVP